MSEEVSVTQVYDHLFIGDKSIARNLDELQSLGINHIVNATCEVRNYFDKDSAFKYLTCPCMDTDVADIKQYFDSAIAFIDSAIADGHGVLVHCQQGVSRSASIVLAYMMKRERAPLREVYSRLKTLRPIVKPKPNFLRQLMEYEKQLRATQATEAAPVTALTSPTSNGNVNTDKGATTDAPTPVPSCVSSSSACSTPPITPCVPSLPPSASSSSTASSGSTAHPSSTQSSQPASSSSLAPPSISTAPTPPPSSSSSGDTNAKKRKAEGPALPPHLRAKMGMPDSPTATNGPASPKKSKQG